ncbi:MAG TPA: PH domain-containing protein [Clostridia bacterium]|nr:PH domain-containing protein [Clostridia bacterium]
MFNTPTRNHISIIIERLGFFFVILVFGAFNFLTDSEQEVLTKEFWTKLASTATSAQDYAIALSGFGFIAVCAIVLLVSFFIWRKTFFYIDGSDFVYERRTIFKKSSRLSILNISTVNIEQNVFERFVGTSKVKIDLNSSHTAQKTDFTFVLKEGFAQHLKEELLKNRQTLLGTEQPSTNEAGPHPIETQAYEPRQTVVSFSIAQVIRHRLLTLPILQGLFAAIIIFSPLFSQSMDATSTNSIVFCVVLSVLGGTFATVYSILNHIGYTVKTDSKNIYISYGVLKKAEYSFEYSKINSVFIKRPLLARIFGLCSLEVAVVGFGNENKEVPQLCLLVSNKQANEILNHCAPDYVCDNEIIQSHKSAFLMVFIKILLFTVVLVGAGLFIESSTYWQVIALLFALLLCSGYLSVITKSIAFDDNLFQYSKGIFSKQTTMVKYGDMQNTVVKTNPITKKYGSGRMNYSILAGIKQKTHLTGYFETKLFEQVSKRVVTAEDKSSYRY